MLRAGRFRHRLLDDDFLKNQSLLAYQCLQSYIELWRQGILNDVEMATAYIFVFSFLRRPKDFLGGPHNQEFSTSVKGHNSTSSTKIVEVLRKSLPPPLQQAKSLTRLESPRPFVDHFCSLSWRSIPLSVARSLVAWNSGQYPLILLTSIPSPEEVLEMQAQGRRCLSMLIEKEEIGTFVNEGRDVLGFIVHDLIHADHFFAHPEKAQAQIHFCQKLRIVITLPEIQKMLLQDSTFTGEFHYLMSDMNSVPLHLLKTLKAILLGYFKRRDCLPMLSSLSASAEYEFRCLFEAVLVPWNLSREALFAAHRLNTPLYKGPQDDELLHLALSLNFHDERFLL